MREIYSLFCDYAQRRCQRAGDIICFGTAKLGDTEEIVKNFFAGIEQLSWNGGSFAVVEKKADEVLLACDPICNIPLFYHVGENAVFVSDNASLIAEAVGAPLKESNLVEMLKTGYVTENETIYQGIYSVMAGEIVCISRTNGTIDRKKYYDFSFQENGTSGCDVERYSVEYDRCLMELFSRLVERLHGRMVLLFLSAGMDSRTAAIMLRRLNYQNVVCVSYGKKGNFEAEAAKNIAKNLGYPWYFVEVTTSLIQKQLEQLTADEWKMLEKGRSIPMVSSICTIKQLLRENKIAKDAVVVTGIALDMLCGSLLLNFAPNEWWTKSQLSDFICYTHYRLHGPKKSAACQKWIQKLPTVMDATQVEYESMNWLWRNRVSKFVANDTASYELADMDWEQPFWEHSICEFWSGVPRPLRWKRYLQKYHMIHMLNPVMGGGGIEEALEGCENLVSGKSRLRATLKHYVWYRRLSEFAHDMIHFLSLKASPTSDEREKLLGKLRKVNRYGIGYDVNSLVAEYACSVHLTDEEMKALHKKAKNILDKEK